MLFIQAICTPGLGRARPCAERRQVVAYTLCEPYWLRFIFARLTHCQQKKRLDLFRRFEVRSTWLICS